MLNQIGKLEQEVRAAIKAADDLGQLEEIRGSYLGKKGAVTTLLRDRADSGGEPAQVGQQANALRDLIEQLLAQRAECLKQLTTGERWERRELMLPYPGDRLPWEGAPNLNPG